MWYRPPPTPWWGVGFPPLPNQRAFLQPLFRDWSAGTPHRVLRTAVYIVAVVVIITIIAIVFQKGHRETITVQTIFCCLTLYTNFHTLGQGQRIKSASWTPPKRSRGVDLLPTWYPARNTGRETQLHLGGNSSAKTLMQKPEGHLSHFYSKTFG